MDILIKNMKLPKDDEVLSLTAYPNGSVCLYMKEVSKAIELPPYIELKNMFNERYDYFKTEGFNHPEREAFDQILCDLKIAPSVLEAST